MNRSVITIAAGKRTYITMACNLALSFLRWNNLDDIGFCMVTDHEEWVPAALRNRITVISKTSAELGQGFASKLMIDSFLHAGENLFIDADCLVYGPLSPVFDAFAGKTVSAFGCEITSGCDIGFANNVSHLLQQLRLDYYPLFVGAVYYIRKGEAAAELFAFARRLKPDYDALGLTRLRGKENEEPLLALAMSKFGQHPAEETGNFKADRMFFTSLYSNVLSGVARLWNPGKAPVPEYSTQAFAAPVIVHFNDAFADNYEYRAEAMRLRKVFCEGWAARRADRYARWRIVYPGRLKNFLKNCLRPVYRLLFGTRKIRPATRVGNL